ncbi:hypothetical protein [Amycolatopsis sp. PS_44_ISF1]|uniref:hypothetical protein n=1 Tax=Amycolatopsis sp. PS_44_ISF1 TaxID=2974917 RepID=UPI0028DF76D2|nr:hypothetical protein [Amycolatopsis sp. PS_44_ISF1]MDT8909637.1 hypothetical protein [Amycolatopsis sp. PS_44_ISF1]
MGRPDFLAAPLPQPQSRTAPADEAFRPKVGDEASRPQRRSAFSPQPDGRGGNLFASPQPQDREDEAFRPPQPQRVMEPGAQRERVDLASAPKRLKTEPPPRDRWELVATASASPQQTIGHGQAPTARQAQGQWAEEEDLLPFDDATGETAATAGNQEDRETPQRQRVTLRTAARPRPREEEDVRVFAAPAVDGLGKFDLGSVPASVTPPKSWRKAAWFATGASGAVVVGLLFAGTFLVGGPATTTDAIGGGWPGRQNGGNPLLVPDAPTNHRGGTTGETHRSSASETGSPQSSNRPSASDDAPRPRSQVAGNGIPASDDVTASDPATGSSPSGPVTTGSPSPRPRKPPVTPALRETKPQVYYTTPADTKKMGDNSEKFFNTVTTDPGAASAVTSGDLHAQGPSALRQHYADVAYFEVKKVTIDPDRDVTVNTVEVTHTDGSKSTEQRTLTFGDNGKITDDGA